MLPLHGSFYELCILFSDPEKQSTQEILSKLDEESVWIESDIWFRIKQLKRLSLSCESSHY